jgi:excinuclease ABC subunit A
MSTTPKTPPVKEKAAKKPMPVSSPDEMGATPEGVSTMTAGLQAITVRGARVNNLKNVNCQIPHGQFTVITGPSGSGKSSLAFDTIYAEGQRRFMESMSSYIRQFLERLEKPDVDSIDHILPAIAMEQKNGVRNARSTVGTATELHDYLRLMFATIGQVNCMDCGQPVKSASALDLATTWSLITDEHRFMLLAPISEPDMADLLKRGFFRAEVDNQLIELTADMTLPQVDVVIDRWRVKTEALDASTAASASASLKTRLLESLQTAYQLGNGACTLVNLTTGERHTYQEGFRCQACGLAHTKPTPQLFSFNSPLGACPQCEGFGRVIGIDKEKVIPNPTLSLAQGAVHLFTTPANQGLMDDLLTEGKKHNIRLTTPYNELTPKEQAFVWQGAGHYPGIKPFFDWLETKKYKVHVRVMLAKYRGYEACTHCHGSRLRPEAMAVTLNEKTILQCNQWPIAQLLAFIQQLPLSPSQQHATQRITAELLHRLHYLLNVGLGYLTLERPIRTLSGGEAQRIHLSTALGSALTETLYVLDEPTVGLHARDTDRLLGVLRSLRDMGNTVLVVEHDPDMIMGADNVIELGPAGGEAGGRIVFEGKPQALLATSYTAMAQALAQRKADIHVPAAKGTKNSHTKNNGDEINTTTPLLGAHYGVEGARGNNLHGVNIELPYGQLVVVTGVSGSGKSTLIHQTLYAGYQQTHGRELHLDRTHCDGLIGLDKFDDLIMVDQTPPGRSARSNAATYLGFYDEIRKLFAGTRQAATLGLSAGMFSFNTVGGRCERCEGLGYEEIDMQFMANVVITCQDCQGKRFKPHVLQVAWPEPVTGKTLDAVFDMTATEALTFFAGHAKLVKLLKPLVNIGLGYLKLGQSTSSLSGGEAQRLKLASHLMEQHKPCLFLFDEPTTGLHLKDIQLLVAALRQLIAAGHSVVVIEHHLDLIAQADYVLDMGPEGGDQGGQVVYSGPLSPFWHHPTSITAACLRQQFNVG